MSEVVDRVARALKEFAASEMLETGSVNETRWQQMARAAIEAMREPGPEVLDAIEGCQITMGHGDESFIHPDSAKEAWQRAIDAALKAE